MLPFWRALGLLLLLPSLLWALHVQASASERATAQALGRVDAAARVAARRARAMEPPGTPSFPNFPQVCPSPDPGCTLSTLFWPPNENPGAPGDLLVDGNRPPDALPSHRLAVVVSWYAAAPPRTPKDILLASLAYGYLLGAPPIGSNALVAGQETLRRSLQSACGNCAPPPALLPTYTQTRFPLSIDIAAEILARGTGDYDPLAPLGTAAAAIRKGQAPSEEALNTVGTAGLVALELGRLGNQNAFQLLLGMSNEGPSAADRLAALFAAAEVAPAALPEIPETERLRRVLAQGG